MDTKRKDRGTGRRLARLRRTRKEHLAGLLALFADADVPHEVKEKFAWEEVAALGDHQRRIGALNSFPMTGGRA